MIVTLAMDGRCAIEPAVQRCCAAPGRADAVRFCSLQDTPAFRDYCKKLFGGTEHGRSEAAIAALTHFCAPDHAADCLTDDHEPVIDAALFKQWHRRGRDPEKLRTIAPAASLSSGVFAIDKNSGKALFDFTVALLIDHFSPFPDRRV